MECLQNIIGVTANTVIPFYDELSGDTQTAIAAGSSGLFMDDLSGGIDLLGIETVEEMNKILALALQARNAASRVLEQDLLVAMTARYQAAKPKFIGDIGRPQVSGTLTSTGDVQGVRLRAIMPIAGTIAINRLSICINASQTFNIYVGRSESMNDYLEEVLYTFPVTTTAGNFSVADMSSESSLIELPLEINGVEQEYYVFWKRSEAGNALAKNNEIRCNTCGAKAANNSVRQFIHADGVALASTENLKIPTVDLYAHGLRIQCTIGCENRYVICREYNKKNQVELLMNWAALYKAGELWIEYIMKAADVGRTNLTNREYLYGKRNHFRKEFETRITAIANQMELGETNCYQCKEDRIIKGTIYS